MKSAIKLYFVMTIIVILGPIFFVSCSSTFPYKAPVNAPLEYRNGTNNQISILSHNIQTVFGKDEDKLDALLDYVHDQQFDFVVLQELFDESAREYIINNTNKSVYPEIVERADYTSFPELLFQDSGLFLMSRYPQVNLSHIAFDKRVTLSHGAIHMILSKELSLSTDFLANKSIMGSLHQIDPSSFAFVFTTHLQALGSRMQKRRQYREIREFIEYAVHAVLESGTVNDAEQIMVLLAGDFNSDAYDEKDLDRLLTNLGNPRDLHREVHAGGQEFTMQFKLFNFQKRFDYIFAYDQIGSYRLQNIRALKVNVTDIRTSQNESISDHRALKGTISTDRTQLAKKSSERYAK